MNKFIIIIIQIFYYYYDSIAKIYGPIKDKATCLAKNENNFKIPANLQSQIGIFRPPKHKGIVLNN